MSGKTKVLEIGPGNFDGKAGLSIIAWNWYQRMDFNKLQIDFLSCVLPSDKYIAYIKKHGGNFYQVRDTNILTKQFQKILSVKSVAKENQYDCVHIHASYPLEAFIYYIAIKGICRKIIIHSHSSEIDRNSLNDTLKSQLKDILNKFARYFLGNERIIALACSNLAAEWMFPKKIIKNRNYTIINNGIDISKFKFRQPIRSLIREELDLENKFVVGHIGRFTFQKNHSFLIDIFNEIYKRNSNSVLLLIGTGELEEMIKRKVYDLKLEDSVIFYGTTSQAYELYQAMDCFVLPSHFEGLGIVTIEAQAAGLKILCANTVPKEARITDLLEYMSVKDDPKRWAEKILSYNDGYERKDMSAELKQAGYDINNSSTELEDLYLECTEKKADSNT